MNDSAYLNMHLNSCHILNSKGTQEMRNVVHSNFWTLIFLPAKYLFVVCCYRSCLLRQFHISIKTCVYENRCQEGLNIKWSKHVFTAACQHSTLSHSACIGAILSLLMNCVQKMMMADDGLLATTYIIKISFYLIISYGYYVYRKPLVLVFINKLIFFKNI